MALSANIEALLREWYSGRDESGAESQLFASRWRDSKVAGMTARSYTPHLKDLGAASPRSLGYAKISRRLAVGADGTTDLRLDLYADKNKPPESVRWRPDGGSLEHVIDRGCTRRDALAALDGTTSLAKADRVAELSREESIEAAIAIRARKLQLSEQAEAIELLGQDATAIKAEIEVCTTKRAALRVRAEEMRAPASADSVEPVRTR